MIVAISFWYSFSPFLRRSIDSLPKHKDRYGDLYVILNLRNEFLILVSCPYLPDRVQLAQPRGEPCLSAQRLNYWTKTIPQRSCFKGGASIQQDHLVMSAVCRFDGFIRVLYAGNCFTELSLEDISSITWLMEYFQVVNMGRISHQPQIALKIQQCLLRRSATEVTSALLYKLIGIMITE